MLRNITESIGISHKKYFYLKVNSLARLSVRITQLTNIFSRSVIETLKVWNIFRGDNKNTRTTTAQKIEFSVKVFFSKCDQIRRKLRIWSYLLKKSSWKISLSVLRTSNDAFLVFLLLILSIFHTFSRCLYCYFEQIIVSWEGCILTVIYIAHIEKMFVF